MACLSRKKPSRKGRYEVPRWQQELLERREELRVGPDDPVHEYDCLRCGGDCCVNTDVLIGPHDVWRIVTSDTGRMHGYMTSHDLFAGVGEEEPPFSYYLGPDSGLPVGCIEKREMPNGAKVCPFLAPVYAGTGPEGRQELLRSEDGAAAGLCALEAAKPTICRAYPLGRLGEASMDGGTPVEMHYVWNESERCRRFRKDRSMTVREYVAKWGLDEAYRQSDLVNEWRVAVERVPDRRARYVLGLLFYDFDLPGLKRAQESDLPPERRYEMVLAARPSSFNKLIERQMGLVRRALA